MEAFIPVQPTDKGSNVVKPAQIVFSFLAAWSMASLAGPETGLQQTMLAEVSTPEFSGAGMGIWNGLDTSQLDLRSSHVLVADDFGNEIYAKAADETVPIASITKLMTAIVTLDAGLEPEEKITITDADRDRLRYSSSRLQVGGTLRRREMLLIALMSSENRAASALARTYPGGRAEFVQAMNRKAQELGMGHTRFVDGTGLDARNVSTARDLARLAQVAGLYPQIHEATTTGPAEVRPFRGKGALRYQNTNRLVGKQGWSILVSKTGFINEAGRCLLMRVDLGGHKLSVVLLDSFGKLTPLGDIRRLRSWIERVTADRNHG